MIRKILIASDHAGFDLKTQIIEKSPALFSKLSLEIAIEDLGPQSDERVDYPDFAKKLCEKLLSLKSTTESETIGILICGSGQGMAIAANKFKGIRAALCWSETIARLSREHNNANILCLSSREISEELNFKILKKFITTDFEGGRHQSRIDKI